MQDPRWSSLCCLKGTVELMNSCLWEGPAGGCAKNQNPDSMMVDVMVLMGDYSLRNLDKTGSWDKSMRKVHEIGNFVANVVEVLAGWIDGGTVEHMQNSLICLLEEVDENHVKDSQQQGKKKVEGCLSNVGC